MLLGADTGGTFTDVVADDGRIAKVMSTPDDPTSAVASGIDALSDPPGPARPQMLAHGTTVATNALLERRGGRVALVTNEGFADLIEIARQDRPSLYDAHSDRPPPLVERQLPLEVAGRLGHTGAGLEPPGPTPVRPAAVAARFGDAVTFDMGGTSTDVCLVLDGVPAPAGERVVAGFPVRVPGLDVHTIGAGGGSIARIDSGGALVVGPQSAGAVPGPACYGRGGEKPTVTDADLVLARIPDEAAFPGLGRLDVAAAKRALERERAAAA